MDATSLILLGFIIFCICGLISNEVSRYKTNKRFEKRMRKLGFAPDGSQLRNNDEILSTDNQEIRSALIERFDGKDLKKIHSDKEGELFITLSSPTRKFVKVINSTAEPDGSFKIYWLRVPANINTTKEAVAWTFGIEGNEYNPIIET